MVVLYIVFKVRSRGAFGAICRLGDERDVEDAVPYKGYAKSI